MIYNASVNDLVIGISKLTIGLCQLSQPTYSVCSQGYSLYKAAVTFDAVSAYKASVALYQAVTSFADCYQKQVVVESRYATREDSEEIQSSFDRAVALATRREAVEKEDFEMISPILDKDQSKMTFFPRIEEDTQVPSSWMSYLSGTAKYLAGISV